MKKLSKPHPSQPNFSWDIESPAKTAKLRMVELPTDETRDLASQAVFPTDELWVPVAVVNGNIHILPGVPRLFEKLLDGMKPILLPRLTDPEGKGIHRILISTPMAESAVAPYLTELADRVESKGVKVGSYPRWGKARNTVTLVGRYVGTRNVRCTVRCIANMAAEISSSWRAWYRRLSRMWRVVEWQWRGRTIR
jgi:molybdopterin-biosynthesis enzyme MoeA-like protein